jgi:hypothetical protein
MVMLPALSTLAFGLPGWSSASLPLVDVTKLRTL